MPCDLDHITYHVPAGTLERRDLLSFFRTIGMEEVSADDEYEHGWDVRWFAPFIDGDEPAKRPLIHLVESGDGEQDALALGHFAVKGPVRAVAARASKRGWLERDSGSGRIWLAYANLRVEVRP